MKQPWRKAKRSPYTLLAAPSAHTAHHDVQFITPQERSEPAMEHPNQAEPTNAPLFGLFLTDELKSDLYA